MASVFSDPAPQQEKKGGASQQKADKKTIEQMQAMSDALQSGNIVNLICKVDCGKKNSTAVLPVYIDYFSNRNMNEITDGHYRVIGKITKIINEPDDSINLLRNTSFSLFQQSVLDALFSDFAGPDAQKAGMEIPNTSTTVNGPAVMILPIAIFI